MEDEVTKSVTVTEEVTKDEVTKSVTVTEEVTEKEKKPRVVYHANLGLKPKDLDVLKRISMMLSKQMGSRISYSQAAAYCFELALNKLYNK